MINRIKAFFVDHQAQPGGAGGHHTVDEFHLAAAALLVEAATIDTTFDDAERGKILDFAEHRLGLNDEEARTLLDAAETVAGNSTQLFRFTTSVKNKFSYQERVELVETLWEVIYADGKADPYEQQLMRRIGGLIYVTDRDSGLARRRVRNRINQS